MMTTNKLTKTFASGSLAIGIATLSSVAGSLLVASSAQASTICYDPNGPLSFGTLGGLRGSSVTCGDKIFTFGQNFFTGDWVDGDFAKIGFGAGEWFFQVAPVGPNPAARTGTISYDVSILPGFSKVFDTIELDSDVSGMGRYQITKDYSTDNGISGQLRSIDGSIDSASIFGAKHVRVVDTFTPNGDELFSADNAFTQKTVPEPGTILGLLAVGGLGLVSRLKKQK
ncbi:PEP-CTERM sorting domain-containing protein [Microcystis aeruginosa]|uniref:Ice-binding protein C-terminal domain-containing protein n=1 Tax=Microcystis aeruginosa NIES-3787 TaxID=2517782 RepID=A0A6H9GG03_MICAE|nr:PEP-CTERM sorting domain-containing protein [Microcystis aeruginosa]GCL45406.1 hypothetical protein NIES3787_10890 [Microcystis aeruginosa NIES-3787]